MGTEIGPDSWTQVTCSPLLRAGGCLHVSEQSGIQWGQGAESVSLSWPLMEQLTSWDPRPGRFRLCCF